jgi:hypothetical protein
MGLSEQQMLFTSKFKEDRGRWIRKEVEESDGALFRGTIVETV